MSMTIKEATDKIQKLEAFFEDAAKRAQEQADNFKDVPGSEAAAAEGWYQKDATDYKNAAQHMRNALAALSVIP